jgi:predicted nucleotidyltransferase
MVATDLLLPSAATALIDQIVERFQPARIILFGSHARGTADPESDLDLLVVMDTPLRPIEQAAAISCEVDHHIPMDTLVRTPDQVFSRDPRDLLLRTIMREGVTIYEAGDGALG